jgi:hypothetical protein
MEPPNLIDDPLHDGYDDATETLSQLMKVALGLETNSMQILHVTNKETGTTQGMLLAIDFSRKKSIPKRVLMGLQLILSYKEK